MATTTTTTGTSSTGAVAAAPKFFHRQETTRLQSEEKAVIYEKHPRWIRGYGENGQTIVDSKRAYLVWEGTGGIPFWAVPFEDIVAPGIVKSSHKDGGRDGQRTQWYDLVHDGVSIENVAFQFDPKTKGLTEDTASLAVLNFKQLYKWLEDDEVVVGHPRSPYHRLDARRSSRHVKVELDGVVLAETTSAIFLYENGHPTRYYINAVDVNAINLFKPSKYQSACAYKGVASYFDLNANGKVIENIVWTYLDPAEDLQKIQGRWSFWNESVDIYVDGELIPRPKRFIVHTGAPAWN